MSKVVFSRGGFRWWLCLGFLCARSLVHAQYTNGIYAEFNTSMGSFTCRLEYALAPKAVANFIGLATGERAWVDPANGRVRNDRFYDGLIFHRVIAGFMNQAGSPNGLGTDGPGYSFVDEFHASLRHDGFGVLSSANSGPDSNGSQFFITVVNTAWLNDVHTIFGRLYGGSNVVYAINQVPTANDKPISNVVLQSVQIRRVGATAQAFDIHAQGLPVVTNLTARISSAGTNISLTFSNRLYADNRLRTATNLTAWTQSELGIETLAPVTNAIYLPRNAPQRFYQLTQVQYADSAHPPKRVAGRTITVTFTQGVTGTLAMSFNNTAGTYTYNNGTPGSIIYYNWDQNPYNGRLLPVAFNELNIDITMALNFTNATSGQMTGMVYSSPFYYPDDPFAYGVSGSFTISP